MEEQSKSKTLLRWVAFLPAAFLGAWVAWLVVMLGNRLTMGMQGIDPDAFVSRAFIEFIAHSAMGVAFVYAGAKVAPSHRKAVAYSLAGIGLVTAGFLLFPAIIIANYWATWAAASLVFGIATAVYDVSTGEVKAQP